MEKAIEENPDAVAVLVNNPTYYGICSDLRGIVKLAHEKGMKVLADEAHGTHLYFGKGLPVNAMAAGADMAAVSMHKSGGSLTQSSMLLLNKGMNQDYVRQIINLTQTTAHPIFSFPVWIFPEETWHCGGGILWESDPDGRICQK